MKVYSTVDEALEGKVYSNLPTEPELLIPLSITRRATVLPSFDSEITDKQLQDFSFEQTPIAPPPKYSKRSKLPARDVNRTVDLFRSRQLSGEELDPKDVVDSIIYWDEGGGHLYLEALAYFGTAEGFVKFKKDIATELHITDYPCPKDGSKDWIVKDVDAKTVIDKKGKRWKCFSIIFVCRLCLSVGRTTERRIAILGFKHTITKLGIGIRDFVNRIRKIRINVNLKDGVADGELELDKNLVSKLTRCPLLG